MPDLDLTEPRTFQCAICGAMTDYPHTPIDHPAALGMRAHVMVRKERLDEVQAALDAALAREQRLRDLVARLVISDLRDNFPDGGNIVLRWDGNRADWEAAVAALAQTPEADDA